MTTIKQIFNPELKLCQTASGNVQTIKERIWNTKTADDSIINRQDMGYIGQMQIEEVWKQYSTTEERLKNIYISNYGYVAEIPTSQIKKLSQNTQNNLLSKKGMPWKDFEYDDKKIFHDCLYDSNANKHLIKYKYCSHVSMRVCLCVKYKYKELHKMVAEKFLEKPIGDDYVVHHLDNNSYNNSVTNLIYLKKETHQGEQHKIYHPMSWK